ncbi:MULTISPECIES: FliI/YscN family ATPase [Thermodesulfobacterium]|jgi:flagellum-specific ATP synthase|uniref:ATP synthase n=1 Tax=Thermodesulfobacterium commune DSM 2178 TaxID=289377 RepID=A0A075WSQ6_9BACT|nr:MULTISPECIES: FliI/YscN family ATPase [Thermodesulfobacterium]KUJ97183.1 MAG: ATPase, FliI/YscN family [Thermodesulfobacterium sp. 37_54]HBT04750.1 FliI/YscN family ATPase [Thermodesulfobacterium commune]AIH03443.1 ATP synthase [Thermodesulfobacterium commune DSM 2178]MBZ4681098.1 fliI [Thermodesulfobacterium sp.]MDN5379094.1 flagellum-specific synthase [Thermodesulfobacterium sp.]
MKVKDLGVYLKRVENILPFEVYGYVTKVLGLTVESTGPFLKVGDLCKVEGQEKSVLAEVVGFNDNRFILTALGDLKGIEVGAKVYPLGSSYAPVGEKFLGRIVNALGEPLDQGLSPKASDLYPLYGEPLKPLERAPIKEILDVGIKAINALLTIGRGQRMAIMAGSGVGKSTLLGMIARYTEADVNVIALIGERGREVREFIERDLRESIKKSVVVVATSDEAPSMRIRAAYYAMSLAEYFRDKGLRVLLLMDSLTRFCMAGREIGLASGEPPTARGYTPSVFAMLPKVLERAGAKVGGGDITAIYTVLVEGDDFNDPIADAVRSIVDGHIVLSRDLAHEGHYPPIDVLASISRLMKDIVPKEHLELAYQTISILATYKKAEDLINIGAYVKGSNPEIDRALSLIKPLKEFLRQNLDEKYDLGTSLTLLKNVLAG